MEKKYYKRLGDYIREVDVRNKKLEVTNLMGININKHFMPSVANVVGTDMSNYKIVSRNQFSCNLMHVGRDGKIPVALNSNNFNILVSPAYFVFEIVSTEELIPDFLMMWFLRSEFDREASYFTDADIRGGLSKNSFLDMCIPVPTIEQQKKIVSDYETLTCRIELNEQMIRKLEDTAQTIYRKMFVDDIDSENLPEGWRMGKVGELFELQRGFDLPAQIRIKGKYPIYASTGIAEYHNSYKVNPPCVITGRSGSIGEVFFCNEKSWPLNTTLWVKDFKNTPPFYVYYKLKELDLGKLVAGFAAVPTLNRNDVHTMDAIIPSVDLCLQFDEYLKVIFNCKQNYQKEIVVLKAIQSLLLTQLV